MAGRRIVLLNMPTEDAEEFVREMANPAVHPDTLGDKVIGATVEAVVARPTVWCKCDVPQESRSQRRRRIAKRESAWVRGKSLGWWICIHCSKPSKAMVLHFVTTMLAGANDLLPQILDESATPLTPTERWRQAGGIPDPHAQTVRPFSTGGPKVRRKKRRSELDREARASG